MSGPASKRPHVADSATADPDSQVVMRSEIQSLLKEFAADVSGDLSARQATFFTKFDRQVAARLDATDAAISAINDEPTTLKAIPHGRFNSLMHQESALNEALRRVSSVSPTQGSERQKPRRAPSSRAASGEL